MNKKIDKQIEQLNNWYRVPKIQKKGDYKMSEKIKKHTKREIQEHTKFLKTAITKFLNDRSLVDQCWKLPEFKKYFEDTNCGFYILKFSDINSLEGVYLILAEQDNIRSFKQTIHINKLM